MTEAAFRKLALSMPLATEGSHMGHPDFRVRNKIFATLGWPSGDWGMVSLTPEQQRGVVKANPATFAPVKGGWGVRGATQVCLDVATKADVRTAMVGAWRNAAPKGLVDELGPGAKPASRSAARKKDATPRARRPK
ncbi:MAG: MmcQ/YjbR family DNA-binding protein [Phycisphaerales bacterium]